MLCFFQYVLPPPFACLSDGRRDNNAKVVHFFDIRGMDTDFSLGKACGECGMIGYRCKYLARSGSVYISKMKAS